MNLFLQKKPGQDLPCENVKKKKKSNSNKLKTKNPRKSIIKHTNSSNTYIWKHDIWNETRFFLPRVTALHNVLYAKPYRFDRNIKGKGILPLVK